jgi:hypothetical protein
VKLLRKQFRKKDPYNEPSAPRMEGFALDRLEARLPGLRRKSFKKTLQDIPFVEEPGIRKHYILEFVKGWGYIFPDASRYVSETETIQVFEIEDSNPLSCVRLRNIQRLAHEIFDEFSIVTELYSVDRYGVTATLIWSLRADLQGPCSKEVLAIKKASSMYTPEDIYVEEHGCYDGPAIGATL